MMTRGRRWAVLVGGAALILALAGCGSETTGAPGAAPSQPAGTVAPVVTPTPLGMAGTAVAESPAVRAAIADLVKRRNADPATITVTAVEPVDWPDASLGCPEPGRTYAQVITPGWRIRLTLDGRLSSYHANRDGSRVVPCDRP